MRRPRMIRGVALLTTGMMFTALAACGGGESEEAAEDLGELTSEQSAAMETFGLDPERPYAGTEMRYLVCCNSASQFASLIERTNEEFTPLTGITVEWADVPYDAFLSQLVAEATTSAGTYDVASWVDAWGPSINGLLEPLDERIAEADIDMDDFPEVFQELSKAGAEDGQYRGIPLRGHAFMQFYRQDIYDQLGLQPATTYAEFAEQMALIDSQTELAPTSLYFGRGATQNLFIWTSMLWSNGGDLLDENGEPAFNGPEGVEAAEVYTSWLDQGWSPPESIAWNETEARNYVQEGNAATFLNWSWGYERFQSTETAAPEVIDAMGFAPLPQFEDGEEASFAQLWPVGILAGSENKDAAWEYIKWLTHAETEKAVVTDKDDPATSTVVAVHTSNLLDPEVNAANNDLQMAMAEALENARAAPLIPEWPEVADALEVAINEIAGGADAQTALDTAADRVSEIMGRS